MKLATILGSLNKDGSCANALKIVQSELALSDRIGLVKIDPNDFNLPFPGQSDSNSDAKNLQQLLSDVSGIIISTPEYHGSFSSIIKLIIENLGFPSVLSGKPISLLGVASGSIGAIKSLEQLRSVCSHIGAIVLPGPVSIANVRSVFDINGNCLDKKVERRLKTLANEMMSYVEKHVCPKHPLEEQVRDNL
ncbi:MAG: NAD(P)H-dependent oxidoreductase [Bacteroidetes bacterium]|nr:NAD(P)H-dependent oxidoreductase [Bacteroidota bacterium]